MRLMYGDTHEYKILVRGRIAVQTPNAEEVHVGAPWGESTRHEAAFRN